MVLLLLLLLALVLLSGDGVPDAAGRLACAVCAASVVRVTRVPCVIGLCCQARSVRPLACLGYCGQRYGTIPLF